MAMRVLDMNPHWRVPRSGPEKANVVKSMVPATTVRCTFPSQSWRRGADQYTTASRSSPATPWDSEARTVPTHASGYRRPARCLPHRLSILACGKQCRTAGRVGRQKSLPLNSYNLTYALSFSDQDE